VAVYACLAARRVAVLLDSGYPAERNAAIASATGVTLTLTPKDVNLVDAANLDATGAAPLMLDVDAPAFTLCTSGSTGQPKAIVHSQRTMLHLARTAHDALHVDDNDRACRCRPSPRSAELRRC
jgi:acyl-coenzyme A synthetase/AMP-(fatty) acid ligase